HEGFAGYTAAVLDIDTLLRLTLGPHEANGFGITVRADSRIIYKSSGDQEGQAPAAGGSLKRAIDFGPLRLQLLIWPMPGDPSPVWTQVPTLILIFGLLLTVLLTTTIEAGQTAHRRSAAIERVNHLLAAEVARRQQAQQELQQMAEELTRSNR